MKYKFDPKSYAGLDKLGRIPLSRSFHMREFLYSEIATHYQMRNVPDDVDRAVKSGQNLCQLLLEPLQEAFGRIHVRSGYRSRSVNLQGVEKHNCATDNDGFHTWDHESKSHGFGAMACISVPSLSKKVISGEIDVATIAWWIFDNLPDWSMVEFFATPTGISFADEVAFNIGWHDRPMRVITNRRGGARNLHENIPDEQTRRVLWKNLSGTEKS
jgi:hypothetical protein